MKKILPILIIGILIISGAGATSISIDKSGDIKEIKIEKFFKNLDFSKKEEYLHVSFDGTNSGLEEPAKPMLPSYIETFEFPSYTRIVGISFDYSKINEKSISEKIVPCPEIIHTTYTSITNKKIQLNEKQEIYQSDSLFPETWYDYCIRCGLNSKGKPSIFVTVEIYPVRYAPWKNILYYFNEIEIKINYVEQFEDPKLTNTQSYDLIVIAPSIFNQELQPLIEHKNAHNTNTLLKTTEEIYEEYSGRDKPEQIKYFIKYAKETWDINYVLLVGGLKSYFYAKDRDDTNQGSSAWHVPVRYANIRHTDEKSCISDLYFGDLYRYNEDTQEREFEDWNSNGDDVIGQWSPFGKDTMDLLPDVYVGRLACRNKFEVTTVVNKIITYESTPPEEKPWFKKMIGVGGMTFDYWEGKLDGEYACDTAIDYMGDLIDEPVRVYASNKDTGGLTIPDDVIPSISEGAGYVLFQGHGNPTSWNTHPAGNAGEWMGATMVYDFWKFSNKEKLPVILVGGCHNGLFNISILQILLNRVKHDDYYWTSLPSPFCFSWGLCVIPNGGAIGSTGCTGLGFGTPGPLNHSGGLETGFFYEIGQNGAKTLGSAHSGSIREFIAKTHIRADEAFCITIWQLFGDPSLVLGGYPSN